MKGKSKRFFKILITILIVISLVVLVYDYDKNNVDDTVEETRYQDVGDQDAGEQDTEGQATQDQGATEASQTTVNYINPYGMTLDTRVKEPAGFTRVNANPDSFLEFTRSLELKEDDSPVLLYNGHEKQNQTAQAAVFALDVGENDLQQCADSIIRVYSEYYWFIGEYEKIRFHLTNGFLMDYESWRDGKRIKVDGNKVYWVESSSYDDSYENFRNYLTNVMIYAGTLSLDNESTIIELRDFKAGDMLLKGGIMVLTDLRS